MTAPSIVSPSFTPEPIRKAPPPLPPPAQFQPTVAPAPIPYANIVQPGKPPPAFAQQFALFSIAAWLFFVSVTIIFQVRGVHDVPGFFTAILILALPVGLILGILAVVFAGKPRRAGVLIPGIVGIAFNGIVLVFLFFGAIAVISRLRQSPVVFQQQAYSPPPPMFPATPRFPTGPQFPTVPRPMHRFH